MGLQKYTTPNQTASLIRFTGGFNSTSGPFGLTDAESSSLSNIDFDKFGSVFKRNGYTAANTVALNSSAQITSLHFYELSSGTKYLVTTAGNKGFYWSSGSISGAPTDITGAITITAGALVDTTTFRDTALFTNGTDAPFQWTGTGNMAAMTVPATLTKARFVKTFQAYTFLANVTVGGTAYASRIYYSNINTVGTWTASDFVDVSRDDGQTITGLRALGDRLVIFKDRSIWIAQFTGDADVPFQFSPTNSAVGCISNFSVQEIDNGLVFLSWDGLYYFDGFNAYKISDRLNSTFKNDITLSSLQYAVSCYQHEKNRYWLALKSAGGANNDLVLTWTRSDTTTGTTDAFSFYRGMAVSALTMTYPDGATETPYFGDYAGFVYKGDTGTDDYPLNVQTAVTAYYYTNWIPFDDICDQKAANAVYIYYQYNTGTLSFVYTYDFDSNDTNTQSFSTSAGGAIWDTSLWDSAVWAGGGGAVTRRDIDGRGRVIRFGFKNSAIGETFQIDGVGVNVYLETMV